MITRFVVVPRLDASTSRVSTSGRSARLNEAGPLACRWEIYSARSIGTFST
jgi:hypothetical protein